MKEKLSKLIDLKTIVTLLLTVVFCILVVCKIEIPDFFVEIYRLLIVFYFGTQYQKTAEKLKENENKEEN